MEYIKYQFGYISDGLGIALDIGRDGCHDYEHN
jgi:hypothetical protein